jgi:hypothetical protein
MLERSESEDTASGDKAGGKSKEPPQSGGIHRVSLQTKKGETLIGVPITVGATEAVPRILLAPVRATICAAELVAKVAGLRFVVQEVFNE